MYYQYPNDSHVYTSWFDASEICDVEFGTTLPTIFTESENGELIQHVDYAYTYVVGDSYGAYTKTVWIGWIGNVYIETNGTTGFIGAQLNNKLDVIKEENYTNWDSTTDKNSAKLENQCAYMRHTRRNLKLWEEWDAESCTSSYRMKLVFCDSPFRSFNTYAPTTVRGPTHYPTKKPTQLPTPGPTQDPTSYVCISLY